ncbi:MAG: hypothetical protein OXQ92_12380 [Boseongicola sp.]|nr:hypothetical protein [Boseongicola sp.]MDD9977792.1 hypothetical protein [Boseongicola sp.]
MKDNIDPGAHAPVEMVINALDRPHFATSKSSKWQEMFDAVRAICQNWRR